MCILCCRSAGVGRTGVFITLSIVLERMRYEGAVDIFQTVKMLRTQRPAMVQTEVKDFLSLSLSSEVLYFCLVLFICRQQAVGWMWETANNP